jgi:signal transduction histidine kinase
VRIGAVDIAGQPFPVSDLGAREVSAGRLTTGQNLVQIDFFSLDFGAGDIQRYQHRLDGADREWSPPSPERSIVYANLAPGRYRFQVRAGTEDSSGSSPALVSFTILPPFWRQWWFLLAGALVVGSIGYGIDHARAARRLAVERVRTRIATDLHDDIGANLSRMAIMVEVLKKQLGEEHAERLYDVADLARELVGSMGDIVWATDPKRDNLKSVVRRLRSFASDVLEGQGIAFELSVAHECEGVKLAPESRRELHLILKEAINNIARHSGATEARLLISLEGRSLVARLRDNGKGLPPTGKGVSSGKGYPVGGKGGGASDGKGIPAKVKTFGSGIYVVHGVSNMKARAASVGGSFQMRSMSGRGTTLRLRIPIGRP